MSDEPCYLSDETCYGRCESPGLRAWFEWHTRGLLSLEEAHEVLDMLLNHLASAVALPEIPQASDSPQIREFLVGAEERLAEPSRPDDPAEIRARIAALRDLTPSRVARRRTSGATEYATGRHDRGLGAS